MKIGIFGGAFDPFHSEHRKIIITAKDALKLDKIVVVPSYFPPHKHNFISDYNARKKMVEAGTCDLPYIVIDDIERERNTINPTNEILILLKEKYPADDFYFIMGGDSMINFHNWIKPEIICHMAKLAVVARKGWEGFDDAVKNVKYSYNADIVVLPLEGGNVSSSDIKARIEMGMVPQNMDNNVLKVIKEEGLYSRYYNMIEQLKADLSEEKFVHTCGTVLYGLKLNNQLNLPYEKVFLACLLHDCAKHIRSIKLEGVPQKVTHQFTGAERAKEVYGITDEEILDAIRYHTTGKADMTLLGKLVYSADMLEQNRDYEGVEELRRIMEKDFDEGFLACITGSVKKLEEEGNPVYYLTKECYEYYNK